MYSIHKTLDLHSEHRPVHERLETLAELFKQDKQPQLTLDYVRENEADFEIGMGG